MNIVPCVSLRIAVYSVRLQCGRHCNKKHKHNALGYVNASTLFNMAAHKSSATAFSGDLIHSSGLYMYQAHRCCSDIPASKTLIHIKIN